jgi:hypothetical protein
MTTAIVTINVFMSLVLLYVAWRVWRLRLKLARLSNWFILAERCSCVLFSQAQALDISRQNIYNLRQTNQVLELQIQQLQQILSILSLGQRFWRRYSRGKVK